MKNSSFAHVHILPAKGICWLMLVFAAGIWVGCKKNVQPTALETSPSGQLSRYDLAAADYDVLPVTAFSVSYDTGGMISDMFEKSGQTLSSFSLSYNGQQLMRALANNLGVQTVTYNADGKPARIDYTTLTDTGKLALSYDASGKLVALLDSVKKPLALPARLQYLYTYDAGGNNVVKITQNQLDLQGRPTLRQYSYYTFDDKPNPFTAFPYLKDCNNLPGQFPALVNKNNVVNTQLVGTILNTSSGGSVPTLDTITNYRSVRTYQYNNKGYPVKASEKFNDQQNNYSGNRTFTYEY